MSSDMQFAAVADFMQQMCAGMNRLSSAWEGSPRGALYAEAEALMRGSWRGILRAEELVREASVVEINRAKEAQ